MWETVTAKVLFWVSGPFAMTPSVRLVARFEKYSRTPFDHENPSGPGLGPNATAGSPRERRPFS
jgi:hypothetical protein